jgi:hypothetical protein
MRMLLALLAFCFSGNLIAQNKQTEISSNIFKSQKAYINSQIGEKQRMKYLSLIHFSNVIHPKVFDEIHRSDSSFWYNIENFNTLEFYSTYNNVTGLVWRDNNVYYLYRYGSDKKFVIEPRSFAQLNDTMRLILTNFNNWEHSIFVTHGQSLSAPTDHPFFLASKYSPAAIQTIGFYFL